MIEDIKYLLLKGNSVNYDNLVKVSFAQGSHTAT